MIVVNYEFNNPYFLELFTKVRGKYINISLPTGFNKMFCVLRVRPYINTLIYF